METLTRVKKVIAKTLNIDISKIPNNAHLQYDLCADSLDILMIRLAVEDEFSITFSNQELKNMLTIETICKTIDGRGE